MKRALITIFGVLFIDQAVKLWIKLSKSLGESIHVFGWDWFQINFVENPGMAFGLEFGGMHGKLALSIFRIIAIIAIGYYLWTIIRKKAHPGFIMCVALVLAGAIGNIIDSAFYGLIFDKGMMWSEMEGRWIPYAGVAEISSDGYAPFLMGHVVDMLYFPVINGQYPDWFPFVGGEQFTFFRPVFNIADSSITIGVAIIFLRQKAFFGNSKEEDETESDLDTESSAAEVQSAPESSKETSS
ncbi:lipoprotein signal peptidase [Halocola ammonii]